MNSAFIDPKSQRSVIKDPGGIPGIFWGVIICLFIGGIIAAPVLGSTNTEFTDTLQSLSSYGDRSTGKPGSKFAAEYIKGRFHKLGFETVGSQVFSVAVVQHQQTTLSIPGRSQTIPIRPIAGNAVTPQTIAPPGITAPLIYVGPGELHHFNGKTVEGAVVLMDLESGKNWLHAANLGARALIYLDRGNSPKIFFEEKFELSPIQFPRFWLPYAKARELFGAFDKASDVPVSDQINLISEASWQTVKAENIYCIIPGTDPKLEEQLVFVEAFYDSSVLVTGISPGADEACGVATLLDLARALKENPPQRTVLLAATGGHAQMLAGMRELIWSLSARSKDMRKMVKQLKATVKDTKKIIRMLSDAAFEVPQATDTGQIEDARLLKAALDERIKTEADKASRELMRLRLQQESLVNQDAIKKLALRRQTLRRLLWQTSFANLPNEERDALYQLVPQTKEDQKAVLADAERHLGDLNSARAFRAKAKPFDLKAAISLHLSSHGDGFGAFNYGWMYPFRPRINRTASHSELDEALRQGAIAVQNSLGAVNLFKDTLRPSHGRSWQSYFLDRPPLGGEVTALAGYHGVSFVTTNDARSTWGTPYDTPDKIDVDFAIRQSAFVGAMIQHLIKTPLNSDMFPRNGFAAVEGHAKFLRHGELFADQPAPGTVLLAYQGPARYHVIVDNMGNFNLRGVADKKHSFHKIIFEGYKFDPSTGTPIWTIDKKQTGKQSYRLKMFRRFMETDLIMFASKGTTFFGLLEPRTFRHMTRATVLDGRRESDPLRWFFSRLDTWTSTISTVFLEAGTPLKLTLSDTVLRNKLILLNNTPEKPIGTGYLVEDWPFLHRTQFRVAHDMWTLLNPRIANLQERGIFNERITKLQQEGIRDLETAEAALKDKRYDQFFEASATSWALASRVYEDVQKTQKDVLYGVLFYIALFVPFAFCFERLMFSYANIYKRIIAFSVILIVLIAVIYQVHPAFQLAYSPLVVVLSFFIMGLSLMVTLIIFFRFEDEMTRLQKRASLVKAGEMGRWKAFVAAFFLGVSNLRRRRLRTTLTCITLIILTFTIMSFTSVKSLRHHSRLLYQDSAPYHGFLLKNVNWRDLPAQAFGIISNTFSEKGTALPRVWLEDEDKTRATRIPVRLGDKTFEAQGLVGLSHEEVRVTGLDEILVGGRWLADGERQAVLLPDRMAQNLGINPQKPKGSVVKLWGMPFDVVGVFSGKKLQDRHDLDGEPLTPVTFPREVSTDMTEEVMDAMESGDDVREFQSRYQHIPGDLTVIMPYQTLLAAGGHLKGVVIQPFAQDDMQTTAEDLGDRFGLSLFSGEPKGTYLYHASDAMSYSGVPNILIPLIISVFIVLNTMIGSVYERKREIGIYTSVGLAPSHVSFLFIAEAMAMAVLSVVLGYLFAQTSAKLFAETSLWSGITVNYSSMAGVGAMILVIAVVLVSTIYPSKVAGEIAIPDVNRSWTLPATKNNVLELTLPFLMGYKEHRSVGGYLYDYFQEHQDVSHGMFSTGNIEFGFACETAPHITDNDSDCPEDQCEFEACLQLRSSVWLAPFDFGIQQNVDLHFSPAVEEPGFLEIRIHLTRISGEANAWRRINKTFLHNIRKQLLLWRSFDLDTKDYYEKILDTAEEKLNIHQSKKSEDTGDRTPSANLLAPQES